MSSRRVILFSAAIPDVNCKILNVRPRCLEIMFDFFMVLTPVLAQLQVFSMSRYTFEVLHGPGVLFQYYMRDYMFVV